MSFKCWSWHVRACSFNCVCTIFTTTCSQSYKIFQSTLHEQTSEVQVQSLDFWLWEDKKRWIGMLPGITAIMQVLFFTWSVTSGDSLQSDADPAWDIECIYVENDNWRGGQNGLMNLWQLVNLWLCVPKDPRTHLPYCLSFSIRLCRWISFQSENLYFTSASWQPWTERRKELQWRHPDAKTTTYHLSSHA